MGSWWNPMTWIKAITVVKSLFDSIMSLYNAYLEKKADDARKFQMNEIVEATKLIQEANKIEDENERLKAKAAAAKALKDAIGGVRK